MTNAEYERFDPSHRSLRGFEHGYSTGDREAVVFVSWENATAYCAWLTAEHRSGRLSAAGPTSLSLPQGTVFRLPSEVCAASAHVWNCAPPLPPSTPRARLPPPLTNWQSLMTPLTRLNIVCASPPAPSPRQIEWERAARADTVTNFWFGDTFDPSKAQAPGPTCPQECPNLTVAQFPPNAFGLFDTVGNVEEWTASTYGPYPGSTARASSFTAGLAVTRGGSHSNSPDPYYLRAANRAAAMPTERASTIGFRAAATLPTGRNDLAPNVPVSPMLAGAISYVDGHLRRPDPPPSTTRAAAGPRFFGPLEYIRFADNVTEDSGGPIFVQHNHAPGLGVLPGGDALIVGWFSTISEVGREPAYAYATLNVSGILGSDHGDGGIGGRRWSTASLLWKAADRGQQTQLFYADPATGTMAWYAGVSPVSSYVNAALVRRELLASGAWASAEFAAWSGAAPQPQPIGRVPLHSNGHIPFERIVPFSYPNGTAALGMASTYIGDAPNCTGCANYASSVVLVSTDSGRSWRSSGGYMSGISQFVVLHDGTWLALGRGGGVAPTAATPGMTRSVSHDFGVTWEHGWAPDLWPISYGLRHVLFRLDEGPLLLISFTHGSNVTTVTGKQRRFTGLYVATSVDDGASFQIRKPLVDEHAPASGTVLPTEDGVQWTMTNSTAEPRGYTSARQTPDGLIHVLTSRLSYHFNLAWLESPPPDAPNSPVPSPPTPPTPPGPGIPAGRWLTRRADWAMHSPTAQRTITAIQTTTVWTAPTDLSLDAESIAIDRGWSFVLELPPRKDATNASIWVLQCPCSRYPNALG